MSDPTPSSASDSNSDSDSDSDAEPTTRLDLGWEAAPSSPSATRGRSVRVTQLVTGLVFLGLAVIWLLGSTGTIDPTEVGQWLPAVLIVAGVTGLAVSTLNNRSRRGRDPEHAPTDQPGYPEDER